MTDIQTLVSLEGKTACSRGIASNVPEILFNNAAIFDMGSVLQAGLPQQDRIFGLNVRAMYRVMQSAVSALRDIRHVRSIVSLASQAGCGGEVLVAHYCASKAAVISCTQSAALALARAGVRANALSMGVTDTPMRDQVDSLFAKIDGRELGEKKRLVSEAVPLGWMGTPEDVAQAALFLASNLPVYITGRTIDIDGGDMLV